MKRLLLLCLATALAITGCGSGPTQVATSQQPQQDPWSDLPDGWSELPAPPIVARPAARIWTGTELFVWSGYEYAGGTAPNQGAIFSSESHEWRGISPSPLLGRYASGSVWTGSEVLIWGGIHGMDSLNDGAAYDPIKDSWRLLPDSSLSARAPLATIWTGKEMIVWASHDRPDPEPDGAAYDPETNTWRMIAAAPVEINLGTAAWTGKEMLVYGARMDDNNWSDTGANKGAAYDPAADSWRVLPATNLSPQATTLAWTGTRAIAWDYELEARAYDPSTDAWEDIPPLPLAFSECYPSSVVVESDVFGWFCGAAALLDNDSSTWVNVSPDDAHLQPTSDVVAPVAAGSLVLLPGISGSNKSALWAYKPSQEGRSGTSVAPDVPVPDPWPDCGKTNVASDDYGTTIHPTSGPPGTIVSFWGTTVRGEDWRWAPSNRLEAWWNADNPGDGLRLARVDDMERCYFTTTFEVPDVSPGTYKISVFVWEEDPGEGYGDFLPHSFTVTRD